jgi:hypothetical protein
MKLGANRVGRPSPAMIIAIIALIASLSGSAYAALGKNSVGARQLKAKAVTFKKIANNAVNGRKVANGSLTGEDINLAQLGTVPSAASASQAGNAATVGGHAAACPAGTVLIRGICFDPAPSPAVDKVQDAAEACANRGGFLPGPLEAYSARTQVNLGGGVFTDTYYANTAGVNYRTIVVDAAGNMTERAFDFDTPYLCAYQLVR